MGWYIFKRNKQIQKNVTLPTFRPFSMEVMSDVLLFFVLWPNTILRQGIQKTKLVVFHPSDCRIQRISARQSNSSLSDKTVWHKFLVKREISWHECIKAVLHNPMWQMIVGREAFLPGNGLHASGGDCRCYYTQWSPPQQCHHSYLCCIVVW